MTDWKEDRLNFEVHQYEQKMMKEAADKVKAEKKAKLTEEWLAIYEKCEHCTSSPSNTRGVIQWFIDNNYETPKLTETNDN